MEKKDLKMYEAPIVEIVEVEAQSVICASNNTGGQIGTPTPDFDLDD